MKNMSAKKQKNLKKPQVVESSSKKRLAIPAIKFKKQSKTAMVLELAVLACIILVGVTGYLWWTKIFMNPERTLNDTIANNLQTRSITKVVDQSGPTGGLKQVTYLSFYPPVVSADTVTTLKQSAGSNVTSVTTETIGTSDSDYVRYTDVSGTQNLQGAQNLKNLLGTWAKRQQNLSAGQQVTFLNESMFGVLPFGYFNNAQKAQLVSIINQENIYKYTDVKREISNHRPVFVYDMSINPADLVTMMQQYVKLSGVGDPNQFEPSQYKGLDDVKIKLTVDILSRQVVEVAYSTGRVEEYSGQNLYHQVNLPQNTIPVEELQRRIQGGSPAKSS